MNKFTKPIHSSGVVDHQLKTDIENFHRLNIDKVWLHHVKFDGEIDDDAIKTVRTIEYKKLSGNILFKFVRNTDPVRSSLMPQINVILRLFFINAIVLLVAADIVTLLVR